MKISSNDPRLTAFVLGEIEDPVEARTIEQAIEASPELQKTVANIRLAASTVEEALAAEPILPFTTSEKAALHPAETNPNAKTRPSLSRSTLFKPWILAAAAAIIVGLILIPAVVPVREVARHASATDAELQPSEPGSSSVSETPATPATPDATANQSPTDPAQPNFTEPVQAVPEKPVPPPRPQPKPSSSFATRKSTRQEMLADLDMAWQRPRVFTNTQTPAGTAVPVQALRVGDIRVDAYGYVPPPSAPPPAGPSLSWNTNAYDPIDETGFRSPLVAPLSTFSIDVDTASYSHVRALLNNGQLPPASAVRVEEFINYFPYDDAPPTTSPDEGGDPFAVHLEQSTAPWAPEHHLLRVALKGYEVPWDERPASNFVFLIDISGSMNAPNRLPLVKEALALLIDRLDDRDRIAIIVYSGSASVALPSTTANNKETIRHAIERLRAGGSTHASDGIQRAYALAREHFMDDGNNRVILCTDGDFNVGITDRGELGTFVEEQADDEIFLAVLGFGMGNYKDNMLEFLSAKGKGVYAYINTAAEARKFFLQQLAGNLFTIAQDVKIQIEFNSTEVKAYRLIGYENRRLRAEDFNNDAKRAGDIGPGHTVTAFYEIVPAGGAMELPGVDPLRYQAVAPKQAVENINGEIATVKLRYKRPGESESTLIEKTIVDTEPSAFDQASEDFRFGAAVTAFGLRLSESDYLGSITWEEIRSIATAAIGQDPGGHRMEFIDLVTRAKKLEQQKD